MGKYYGSKKGKGITYAYYFDKTAGSFDEEQYTLDILKKLESEPGGKLTVIRKSLYVSRHLVNGLPPEENKVDYHGKSRNEFHRARKTTSVYDYTHYNHGNESKEHDIFIKVLKNVTLETKVLRIIVDNKFYTLDVNEVYDETGVNMAFSLFKPDLRFILADSNRNKEFIETYDKEIHFEVCMTHPNDAKKIDAYWLENAFLVEIDISKYYKMTETTEAKYIERITNQIKKHPMGVDVHSYVLHEELGERSTIKDDKGKKYVRKMTDPKEYNDNNELVYNVFCYKKNGKFDRKYNSIDKIPFTKELARKYMLYLVRKNKKDFKKNEKN